MQPDKEESSVEAQESIPEEVTIDKGKFYKQESEFQGAVHTGCPRPGFFVSLLVLHLVYLICNWVDICCI